MQVALFDFDETLIRQNSLGSLFKATSNLHWLWPHALPAALTAIVKLKSPRRAIKERLYQRCLANCSEDQLYQHGFRLAPSFTPIWSVVDALHTHANDGGAVWIVTASPGPFVCGILDGLGWPYERLLGTELPQQNGVYTGELTTECSHTEKVRRIEQEMLGLVNQPDLVLAYGNLPPDAPMLTMANIGYAVSGEDLTLFSYLCR